MRNVTNVLSEEHRHILKAINSILKECERIEDREEFNTSYFESMIEFIKNYADKYHHAKEEDILFRVMLENVEDLHCNPIPVMLHEHDAGRNYVRLMEEGLYENNKEKVIENAKNYCYLLQDHIYKEDNILFPMAEAALREEQKAEVLKRYKEIEKGGLSEKEIQVFLSKV